MNPAVETPYFGRAGRVAATPEIPAAVADPLSLPEPKEAGEQPPDAETVKAADEIRAGTREGLRARRETCRRPVDHRDRKGVTISVTDQLDFGMFEIGSAVPRREMVLAMEKIAKTLSAQKGSITISGHTDGRPFKSETYDNWRLSTARAHSAYYMLVRAGLDERRITEVAGLCRSQAQGHGRPVRRRQPAHRNPPGSRRMSRSGLSWGSKPGAGRRLRSASSKPQGLAAVPAGALARTRPGSYRRWRPRRAADAAQAARNDRCALPRHGQPGFRGSGISDCLAGLRHERRQPGRRIDVALSRLDGGRRNRRLGAGILFYLQGQPRSAQIALGRMTR